ncbi:MAG: glycosyltransferase family protein [Ignavibacteria bacterium]|nr:glycosyltransferase family protein [Ignavibacteria bacterium]
MSSTRLLNKIMIPLADKPLLVRMMERVTASRIANNCVVATTDSEEDDIVVEICKSENIKCFRGHPTDLLDRHYKAGLEFNADVVVKIPSDCPLIDHEIIDKVLCYYIKNKDRLDFISNLHPATYPDGNDVEVIPMKILETVWRKAKLPLEREHTTPFIWENPQQFMIGNVEWETGLDYSMSHRFTIDYYEDYEFIKSVYDNLYKKNPSFGLNDILRLLDEEPELMEINKKYAGVNWYRNHLNELKTITEEQTKLI